MSVGMIVGPAGFMHAPKADKPKQKWLSFTKPKWRRAFDGFVHSHCGGWVIVPCYAGCTRPQDYQLWFDGRCVSSMNATQRDAKLEALRLCKR